MVRSTEDAEKLIKELKTTSNSTAERIIGILKFIFYLLK
jgi:hypothetical protein